MNKVLSEIFNRSKFKFIKKICLYLIFIILIIFETVLGKIFIDFEKNLTKYLEPIRKDWNKIPVMLILELYIKTEMK